ncbi:uncharacterized protein BT62DRAFT_540424 [Guyanagaster necrorhizus]|uniref:Uncharacterized protein n=1 Tax=Guyanagaster necrorhizus TaxID=856835 RepID=A0A9P7W2N1_9AGAR|nr:uncharacterized protein BT62DRAFT_540424 [Guyanagaster necrorhizus MCA 3950]KAG7450855.1 hypothetical protein BT62DRAFT_540424 [Guyanagaster necrorhizus MCA 3950]
MGLVISNPLRHFKWRPKQKARCPVLPQELIDCVLDQLCDDHQTLIVCLRAGRPFLARARVHIFSSVHIQLEPRRNTWKQFLRLFSSSPHLAPLVHTVHLQRNHQWPTERQFMSATVVVRVLNSLVNLEEIKLQGYGPKIFRRKETMEASLFTYLLADNRIKRVYLHDCKFFRQEDLFAFLRGFPEMKELWISKGFKCPVSTSAFSNDLPGESGTIYLETLQIVSDWKNPLGVLAHPQSPLSLKKVKSLIVGTDSCIRYEGALNVVRLADGFQKLTLLDIGVYEALVTHDVHLNPFPIHQLRCLTFGLNTDKLELAPLLGKWVSLFNNIQSECALRKVTIVIFGFYMQQWPFHFVCDRVQWTRLDISMSRWSSLRKVNVNVKVHRPKEVKKFIEATCCGLMKKNLLHFLDSDNSISTRL